MNRILMLLSKDWTKDVRVRKEVNSLSKAGFKVGVLHDSSPRTTGVISTVLRLVRFQYRCLNGFNMMKPDIVHAHDLDTLPMGVLISKLKGTPLVYDAHESYTHMVSSRLPEHVVLFMQWIEHKLTRHADRIILANEKIGPNVSDEPDKWVVVMNCVNRMQSDTPPPNHDGFTMGYFGSIEEGRFVQGLIDAVRMVKDWRLVIAGNGSFKLEGLDDSRICYLGYVDPDKVGGLMNRCDLLSVIFEDGNFNDYIGTPNRLFEAMALGIPVVANWNTYSGEITRQTDCGYVIAPNRFPLSYLLNAIAKNPEMHRTKREAGLKAWESEYNWCNQEKKLIGMYEEIVDGG